MTANGIVSLSARQRVNVSTFASGATSRYSRTRHARCSRDTGRRWTNETCIIPSRFHSRFIHCACYRGVYTMTCPYGTGVPYTGGQCPYDHGCDECEHNKPICTWRTKHNGQLWDVWVTDCGHEYVEGRLTTNSQDNDEFKFCPYCGNEIRW